MLLESHIKEFDSPEILDELGKLPADSKLRAHYHVVRNICEMYHYKAIKALENVK